MKRSGVFVRRSLWGLNMLLTFLFIAQIDVGMKWSETNRSGADGKTATSERRMETFSRYLGASLTQMPNQGAPVELLVAINRKLESAGMLAFTREAIPEAAKEEGLWRVESCRIRLSGVSAERLGALVGEFEATAPELRIRECKIARGANDELDVEMRVERWSNDG